MHPSIHAAQREGEEFSVVIMFGMDDGRLPRRNSNPRDVIEARRLFYVGITRAKSELHVMYAARSPSPFVIDVQRRLQEEG